MKVGILTFFRGPNYGGYLQAWHLREAIRALGYDANLVNYQGLRHHQAENKRFWGVKPSQVKGMCLHYLKSRPFNKPVGELCCGRFNTDPNRVDWSSYDTVVVGSDIVWDFCNPYFGNDPTYFGSLPSQSGPRFISYAASCGETNSDAVIPDYVRLGLGVFHTTLVRDQNTATMVEKSICHSAPVVVDPTWLQDDPVVSYTRRPRQPYVLLYGHGADRQRSQELRYYCNKRNLKIVAVAFPCSTADKRIFSIGPFEWVDLYRNATAVVTSTFHGLLYAIKFGKPVLFMERGASRLKGRIAIERCGLDDRLVPEGIPFEQSFIEYALSPDRPTSTPSDWIEESRNHLRYALNYI